MSSRLHTISRRSGDCRSGRIWGLLFAFAVLLAGAQGVVAQSKSGTTIGQFLLIEPSARAAGMGNAAVASFSEPAAGYFNPGAMGQLERSGIEFTHSPWIADITYDYVALALRLGAANTLSIAVTSLSSGDIAVRTVNQPLGTGEQYSVNDLAVGVGLARRITDRFSGGVHVKFVQETIWNSSLHALAMDAGVLYELPFRAYLGASLSNFGSRGSFDGRDLRVRFDQDPDKFGDNSSLPAALETEDYPLPIFFRVGLGYPVSLGRVSNLLLAVDAFHPNDNNESVSVGAEWSFQNLLFVRGGYQNLFLDDAEAGLALGAGLLVDASGFEFRFDYAWNDFGRLGDAQRFTVGFARALSY